MNPSEFGSDPYISEEILKLRDKFNVETMIETGTSDGLTTRYFANVAKYVHTIEILEKMYKYTKSMMEPDPRYKNVIFHHGNSGFMLEEILSKIDKSKPILFYLDAHWYDYWPILDELKIIGKYCHNNAIIVIDDFKVPNTNLGYDLYNNQPLDYNFISSSLSEIYDSYCYHYNSEEKTAGCRRGKIFIYPFFDNYLSSFRNATYVSTDTDIIKLKNEEIKHENGLCYYIDLPKKETIADNPNNTNVSKLKIYENDKELPYPHSLHVEIRNKGEGRYSHWGSSIRFSSMDNTDPRLNGRKYVLIFI